MQLTKEERDFILEALNAVVVQGVDAESIEKKQMQVNVMRKMLPKESGKKDKKKK